MPTLTLTRKIKLSPTPEQEVLLHDTALAYTNACNDISRWCADNKTISKKRIQEATYRHSRGVHGLPSQMAISAIRSVTGAYQTIHATQKRWSITPQFKKQKYSLVWNRDFSLNKQTGDFSLNTVGGRQKIATEWSGNEAYRGLEKYGTATIAYRHGHWFIFVPVTVEAPEPGIIQNVVGVDLGINFLATAYDSAGRTHFFSGREVKDKRAHYKKLRAGLQKRGTRSARKRLAAIGSRENRWMNDINHRITKALATTTTPTLFVLEDLSGVRAATEKVRKKNRYVQVSWAFFDFRTKMEYKAALYGHEIIFVDPKYTSQTCPKCGNVDKLNRNKKTHSFECRACHYRSNDDRVGAMNLHNKGIQYRTQVTTGSAGGQGAMSTVPQDVPSI